jgi:hypothetical protein
LIGPIEVSEKTRSALIDHAKQGGEINRSTGSFAGRVGEMLQLIVATAEYQYN